MGHCLGNLVQMNLFVVLLSLWPHSRSTVTPFFSKIFGPIVAWSQLWRYSHEFGAENASVSGWLSIFCWFNHKSSASRVSGIAVTTTVTIDGQNYDFVFFLLPFIASSTPVKCKCMRLKHRTPTEFESKFWSVVLRLSKFLLPVDGTLFIAAKHFLLCYTPCALHGQISLPLNGIYRAIIALAAEIWKYG